MSIKIPFTVYAKVVPDRTHNKRRTYTKSLEKITQYVADDIAEYIAANPDTIHINGVPKVSGTVQFAQFPSRVTITGWDIQNIEPFQVGSKVKVDAPQTSAEDDDYSVGDTPGKVVSGYTGTQYLHPQGQTFDPQLLPLVQALKAALEAASPWLSDIYRIDYMGASFGKTGKSF